MVRLPRYVRHARPRACLGMCATRVLVYLACVFRRIRPRRLCVASYYIPTHTLTLRSGKRCRMIDDVDVACKHGHGAFLMDGEQRDVCVEPWRDK